MRRRYKKKGSLELGVNSIVILIIAMAVLGLIIYFIYKNLNVDIPKLPQEHAASVDSSTPITTSPARLSDKPGQKIEAYVNVYNANQEPKTVSSLWLVCKDDTPIKIEIASSHSIPAYDSYEFTTLFTFPKKPKDLYLCTIKANEVEDAVSATVAEQVISIELK